MHAPQHDERPPHSAVELFVRSLQPVVVHVEPVHPSYVLIPWTNRNLATSLLPGRLRLSHDLTLDPTCPFHAPVQTSLCQSLPRSYCYCYCYCYCVDYRLHEVPDHRLHSIRDLQLPHHTP